MCFFLSSCSFIFDAWATTLAFFLASNLDLSISLSASDLAAPVLPFFCTCSLASRSASAHSATGPGNLPYQAYHILLNACEVGEGKGRMGLSSLASLSASSHLSAGFHRMFAVCFNIFFRKPLRSSVWSAFFEPTMLLQYQLASWFWSFEPILFRLRFGCSGL